MRLASSQGLRGGLPQKPEKEQLGGLATHGSTCGFPVAAMLLLSGQDTRDRHGRLSILAWNRMARVGNRLARRPWFRKGDAVVAVIQHDNLSVLVRQFPHLRLQLYHHDSNSTRRTRSALLQYRMIRQSNTITLRATSPAASAS